MPNFVFAYHGLTRPKDGAQHMTRWKAWMNSLGAAMINPGVPLGMSKTVTSEGVIDGGGACYSSYNSSTRSPNTHSCGATDNPSSGCANHAVC